MLDYELIDIKPLPKELFDEINNIFENDSSVSKFVSFNYHTLVTNGIFYDNQLIGLLNLNYFICGNIAISIALLESYRNRGITKVVLDKIVEYYGKTFSDSSMFIANVLPSNQKAILSFRAMGLKETYEFDEIMLEEGAEVFYNFYKENPYRKKVNYD